MRGGIAVLLVAFALAGCEGPEGPTGPQGDEGPPGPGTRITFTGQFDGDGTAVVGLPSEAGTLTDLPAITCYESSDGSTWAVVADGWDASDSTVCMVNEGSGGALNVVFIRGVPDWHYFLSVVY